MLPTREEAQRLLEGHVKDEYQRYHSKMVAIAMEGYAEIYGENKDLWYLTGLLHDLDFGEHPDLHPAEELKWFKEWGYSRELSDAVETHAYGYHGYSRLPQSKLDATILACDEISGIFYAYQKINPVKYGDIKVSSIVKRFKEKAFAAKIDRGIIMRGVEALGITLEDHIANLIKFFSKLD